MPYFYAKRGFWREDKFRKNHLPKLRSAAGRGIVELAVGAATPRANAAPEHGG